MWIDSETNIQDQKAEKAYETELINLILKNGRRKTAIFFRGKFMSTWTAERIDSLEGKTFVVTGGTSGIGLETVKHLLEHGGLVIIGSDDVQKGEKVLQELRRDHPKGGVRYYPLDLSSQRSVFAFVEKIMHDHSSVDVLINNAGISGIPQRMESPDGHEFILSVNYLGHFVLTSQLFPLLLRGRDSRIVSVCSLRHRAARINLEDLDYHTGYKADVVYSHSKLALLMLALELHRRCRMNDLKLRSIPVHPGAVDTEIFDRGPIMADQYFHPILLFQRLLIKNLGQRPDKGALPLLFAATSLEARSGIYYGPDGFHEIWGNPTEANVAVQAENMVVAGRLWEETEKMTGIRFDVESSRSIGLH